MPATSHFNILGLKPVSFENNLGNNRRDHWESKNDKQQPGETYCQQEKHS